MDTAVSSKMGAKETLKRENYFGLYCLKALCALFVVIYHVPVAYGHYSIPIAGIAVPCFFMISGFLLYSNSKEKEIKTAWKWIKKIILTSVLLQIFYFFVNYEDIIGQFRNQADWYLPLLFQGGVLCGALWYLTAFWEALLCFIVVRYFLGNKLLYIAPVLVILGLYAGRYGFVVGSPVFRPWLFQSFLAAAIPYMSLGYLVHKHKEHFTGAARWLICAVVFAVLIYLERYFLQDLYTVTNEGTFYIFTMPLAFSFFILALNWNKNIRGIVEVGKYHSSNIYYFHLFIAAVLHYLLAPNMISLYRNFGAVMVYFLCILMSMLLIRIKKHFRAAH